MLRDSKFQNVVHLWSCCHLIPCDKIKTLYQHLYKTKSWYLQFNKTYNHQTWQTWHWPNRILLWSCDHVTPCDKCTFTRGIGIKHGRILNHGAEHALTKSHVSFIIWSHDVTWLNKKLYHLFHNTYKHQI